MPELDGSAVLGELAERLCNLPIIIMTGHGDVDSAVRAMKMGAADFIEKPFEDGALIERLSVSWLQRICSDTAVSDATMP